MTDLEQIKQKIDIVSLISETVQLKKTGANFKGLCPFHSEKTPSFVVSPERQIWHCFGSCQDGGDIFKFVMKLENVEFPESLRMLAKRAGVTLEREQFTSKTGDLKERIYQVNHLASEFYNYILTSHPLGEKARDYLKSRQITKTSVTLFSLGYAPNSWDSLHKFLTKKGYDTNLLESAGLLSKSDSGKTFDRFRGRFIFTLKDQNGNIVGFAGRVLDPEAQQAKYINTAETPVYIKGNVLYGLDVTKQVIKKEKNVVVVEGEIDLIQSYQVGVHNVVAIKGSALTEGQVILLKRYTPKISLSLDADFAGDAAAHRGILTADQAGLDITVITFDQVIDSDSPAGELRAKDPDELIKKDPGLWRKAVDQAVPFYEFIISSALQKHDKSTAEGQKKIVAETAQFLGAIDNSVVKSHYLKKLATALTINAEALAEQMEKDYKKSSLKLPMSYALKEAVSSKKNRQEILSDYLLALLLQSQRPQDYLVLLRERVSSDCFPSSALSLVFQKLLDYTQVVPLFSIQSFIESLPPELVPTVDKLFLETLQIDVQDDQEVLHEITTIVWELREVFLKNKLKALTNQIKGAPEGQLNTLEKSFQEASLELSQLASEKRLMGQSIRL